MQGIKKIIYNLIPFKSLLKILDEKLLNNRIRRILIKSSEQDKYKDSVIRIRLLKQYKDMTYWNFFFDHIILNKVEGDIVECGVGNGQTISYILYNLISKKELSNRLCFGFDSFEGFPEPHEKDKSPRNPLKGQWNHVDEKFVLSNLIDLGFNSESFKKIKLVKGFFDKSFRNSNLNINKISLLHLDCDIYPSYKISLETWFDKVEKNGIIVFDEYLNTKEVFPGAVKAIDEFFGEKKKDIKLSPITGRYYYIKN